MAKKKDKQEPVQERAVKKEHPLLHYTYTSTYPDLPFRYYLTVDYSIMTGEKM